MKPQSVQRNALIYGSFVTALILVVGSIVGYLVAGVPGLVSALIGAGVTAVFMGLTALSVLIAGRFTEPTSGGYFGIVLGTFALKFVVFIIILLAVRGQDWLNPWVFFVAMIAAVVGSLVADIVAVVRTRVPYVDVTLPGSPAANNSDS